MAHRAEAALSLPEFRNEPYTDFSQPEIAPACRQRSKRSGDNWAGSTNC